MRFCLSAVTRVLDDSSDVLLAIVFGSFARGDQNVNSDLDLAIAADHV